jgi:hypothetical protein
MFITLVYNSEIMEIATTNQPDADFQATFDAVKNCVLPYLPGKLEFYFFNYSRGDHLKMQSVPKLAKLFQRPAASLLSGIKDKFIIIKGSLGDKLPNIHQLVCCFPTTISRNTSNDRDRPRWEVYGYPYSPVSNFVVTAIKGRSWGEFVMSRGSGLFLANPATDYSQTLLESLNNMDFVPNTDAPAHTIAEAARLLFQYEQDFFQDNKIYGWRMRRPGFPAEYQNGWGPRKELNGASTIFFDEYFLPTLLETEVYNFERWKSYPYRKRPSVWNISDTLEHPKDKNFFVGISPYRDSTIIMLNYPTMSAFGEHGELVSVDLQLGWVTWIINGIISLLSSNENRVKPDETKRQEKHLYWSAVNTGRVYKFMKMTTSYPNLPIIPFENVLKEIESNSAKYPIKEKKSKSEHPKASSRAKVFAKPTSALEPTEFCEKCGNPIQKGDKFCGKCGLKI